MATRPTSKKRGKGRQKSKAAQHHEATRDERLERRFERAVVDHPEAVTFKHADAPDKVFASMSDAEKARRGKIAVVVMTVIVAVATGYLLNNL